MMAPTPRKPVRGVYEKPKGSDIWWIHYYEHGRRRRERVGTHGNAVKLYQKRKTQILTGDKLPELQRRRVTLGDLIDDAIAYAREHNRSFKDYEEKGELLRPAFGNRTADDVKPEEIAAWIRKRDVGPATFNRYRSFLSLCYREGMRMGKVSSNPARLLKQKREPQGRKRFLSHNEFEKLRGAITDPVRRAAFEVSVFTGMRLSEQFKLPWKLVDLERREIYLPDWFTKNGCDRTVPLNSIALAAIELMHTTRTKRAALVFPRKFAGKAAVQPRWFAKCALSVEIEDYTWHNNRHTFCSWHAMAGTPLKTIQELAGHKTISITARYAHLAPSHIAAEQERIVPAFGPKVISIRTATKTAIG